MKWSAYPKPSELFDLYERTVYGGTAERLLFSKRHFPLQRIWVRLEPNFATRIVRLGISLAGSMEGLAQIIEAPPLPEGVPFHRRRVSTGPIKHTLSRFSINLLHLYRLLGLLSDEEKSRRGPREFNIRRIEDHFITDMYLRGAPKAPRGAHPSLTGHILILRLVKVLYGSPRPLDLEQIMRKLPASFTPDTVRRALSRDARGDHSFFKPFVPKGRKFTGGTYWTLAAEPAKRQSSLCEVRGFIVPG